MNSYYYELIVKLDCSFCRSAIELLDQYKIPFILVVVDKNPKYLEKAKKAFNHETVPMVFKIDERETQLEYYETKKTFIGGYDELKNSFNENQHSTNKM